MTTQPQPAPLPPARPPIAHHHEFAEMIQSLMIILVIATFVTTFLVQPHRIPSGSMEPTLLVGDFVLVTKNSYTPVNLSLLPHASLHRGEIIVFLKPGEPDTHLVKRIIGLPGDRIHLHNGHVFVNDAPLAEPYAVYRPLLGTTYRDEFPTFADQDASILPGWHAQLRSLTLNGNLVVPPRMYFVLGDNRNDSLDSRYWGLVPDANILGTPWLVYFSLRSTDPDDPLPFGFSAINADARPRSLTNRALTSIANFARWDRCLHLVQ